MTAFGTLRSARDRSLLIAIAALGVIAIVLAITRLVGLDHSFWEDEALTAFRYVSGGPSVIFDPELYRANNHLLFSLVAWALTGLFGESEIIYRLGSLVPALVAVGIATWWAWRRFGAWAGVAAAFLLTVSPLHLSLARQARGYGLTIGIAAVMFVAAVAVSERGDRIALAAFGLLGLAGIMTLAIMVLPFLAHAAVLAWRRDVRRWVFGTVAVVGFASVAFYWPLLDTMRSSLGTGSPAGNRGSAQIAWHGPITEPIERIITPILGQGIRIGPAVIPTLVAFALVASAVTWLWRSERRDVLAHLVAPLVLPFAFFWYRGMLMRDRFVSFMLVPMVLLVVLGLVALWRSLPDRRWSRVPAVGLALLVSFAVLDGFTPLARRTATQPIENYKDAAAVIEGSGYRGPILSNDKGPMGFSYYLGKERMASWGMPAEDLEEAICTTEGPAVFIDYPLRASRRRDRVDLTCLTQRWTDATVIHINQLRDTGIDVWLKPQPKAIGTTTGP